MARRIPPFVWYLGGSLLFLIVVSVLIAGLAGVFHRKIGSTPATRPAAAVRLLGPRPVVAVREVEVPVVEAAVGTIGAVHETTVAAKITARVTEVNVTAGATVQKDAVLIRLDDADLQARVKQAEAAEAAAAATRAQAQIEFERVERLYQSKNAAQIEYDQARTNLETATSNVQAAQQARQGAQAVLDYATIRSPMNGRVIDKLVDVGDIATPGEPLIKMYDASQMQLVASVRESLTHRLHIGEDIPVRIDALNKTCTGQVREIVPEAQAASRSFSVKVSGPCPPGLYTGMFGRLLIPMEPERVLAIPAEAIEHVGQLRFVDVAERNDPNTPVARRAIQPGRTLADGNIEVLSGLAAGELVAVRTGSGD